MSSPQEIPTASANLADKARNLICEIVQLHFGTLTKRQVLAIVPGWLEDKLGYKKRTIVRCLMIDSSEELSPSKATILENICYALGRYISEFSNESNKPIDSTLLEITGLIGSLLEYDRYDCRLNIITRLSRELGVTNNDINKLLKGGNPYRIPSANRIELKNRVLNTLKSLTTEPAKKVIANVLPFLSKKPEEEALLEPELPLESCHAIPSSEGSGDTITEPFTVHDPEKGQKATWRRGRWRNSLSWQHLKF